MMTPTQKQGNVSRVLERSPWWMPWLILVLMLIGWGWNQSYARSIAERDLQARIELREATVASCERVNDMRRLFNERGNMLREFLNAAADTRQRAADILPDGDPQHRNNLEAAARYRELSNRASTVALTECEEAFPEQAAEFTQAEWETP